MDMVNLIEDWDKLPDHHVVAYAGLEGELVVAVQCTDVVLIRVTVTAHGPPQIMMVEPFPDRSR